MRTLLYIADGCFGLMAIGIFVTFVQSRRHGLLLGVLCFGLAAVLSYTMLSWWPLLGGFLAAWVLRLAGGDPGYR